MPLHPLKLVLELPERLAVNERNTDELINHLVHGRLDDGFRSIPLDLLAGFNDVTIISQILVDHCTDIANADFLMRAISPASILVNPKHFLPKSFSDAPIR